MKNISEIAILYDKATDDQEKSDLSWHLKKADLSKMASLRPARNQFHRFSDKLSAINSYFCLLPARPPSSGATNCAFSARFSTIISRSFCETLSFLIALCILDLVTPLSFTTSHAISRL
jgi:hypothetical protein